MDQAIADANNYGLQTPEVQVPDFMRFSPQFTEGLDNSMYGADRMLFGSNSPNELYYDGDVLPGGMVIESEADGITNYDFDQQPQGIVNVDQVKNLIANAQRNNFKNFYGNPDQLQGFVDRGNPLPIEPKQSVRNIIGSQLQNAKTNIGQKVGQGMDFMGGIKDYIMGGGMLGMAAKGIGGLLSNIFQESPEQTNFKENIATDPEYQNLVNSIPGMSNYNQIFAMGSGRGLMGAINKRLATLARTEKRQGVNFSDTLKERRKKLEALREIERQKESAFLESQRRGSRPTAPTGGGTRDDQSDRSRGQTGGYSYSGGKREGFGYGLKDGGIASMFTRRG